MHISANYRAVASNCANKISPCLEIAKKTAVSSNDAYLSTLLNQEARKSSIFDCFFEKLQNVWKWVLSWVSPSNASSQVLGYSNISPHVQEMIDFGSGFITRSLQQNRVQTMINPSCKLAIVVKLNQQVISQQLTVVVAEALNALSPLAIQKLTHDLAQHGTIPPTDVLRMKIYCLKPSRAGFCCVNYEFGAQRNGFGHDCPCELTMAQTIRYFLSKYGNDSVYREDFLRFMMSNS